MEGMSGGPIFAGGHSDGVLAVVTSGIGPKTNPTSRKSGFD